MATLTIRKLDDDVYARLKARAQRNGRSLEAEARVMLSERVGSFDGWIDDLAALRTEIGAKYGVGFAGNSVDLIRQVRDEG